MSIVCSDVSDCALRREVMLNLSQRLKQPTEIFYKKLILKSDLDENKEQLKDFSYLLYLFNSSLLFQSVFFNTIILNKGIFNMNAEIINLVEAIYPRAMKKGISITYIKDKGTPESIDGDCSLFTYILQSIFIFAIEKAIDNSEISLIIEISVTFI